MAMSARGWPSRGRCAQRSRQLAWPGGWSRRSIPTAAAAPGRRAAMRAAWISTATPFGWRPLDPPGGTYYAGPRAMSEPETRAIVGLTRRVRPTVAVWFHQHARLVDLSRGDRRIIRRYGRRVGLPAINYGTRPAASPPGRPPPNPRAPRSWSSSQPARSLPAAKVRAHRGGDRRAGGGVGRAHPGANHPVTAPQRRKPRASGAFEDAGRETLELPTRGL